MVGAAVGAEVGQSLKPTGHVGAGVGVGVGVLFVRGADVVVSVAAQALLFEYVWRYGVVRDLSERVVCERYLAQLRRSTTWNRTPPC